MSPRPIPPLPEPLKLPPRVISPLDTSITAFLGRAFSLGNGSTLPNQPTAVSGFAQFETLFGGLCPSLPLTYAVSDFFNNGGTQAIIVNLAPSTAGSPLVPADFIGDPAASTGLHQLDSVALFNTLCIPPDTFDTDIDPAVWNAAATYCQKRSAMLIIDPPAAWSTALSTGNMAAISTSVLNVPLTAQPNVAIYLPRIEEPAPLSGNPSSSYAPCGAVAGVWARTDAQLGVWKAPAGQAATLQGVAALELSITDAQDSALNDLGLNSLRTFTGGSPLVWGARTLAASQGNGDYKYISVRRLALFIETSIATGTRWAAGETQIWVLRYHWVLLKQIQDSITAFLHQLYLKGALMGDKPEDAYLVRCDATNNTQSDVDNGVVNIMVGFAPLIPAEFVVLQIQQITGQNLG